MRNVLFITSLLMGFGLLGCSDDTDPVKTPDSKVPTTDAKATDAKKTDAKATDAKATDAKATDAKATGACVNTADTALLDTKDKRDAVTAKATACGTGCLVADAAPAVCSLACVKKETNLSEGCSTCYATIISCVFSKCLSECAAAPTSTACGTCRETNCNAAFYTCSGLAKE
jgi:hypothetical protein